jgi:hypothetical protein
MNLLDIVTKILSDLNNNDTLIKNIFIIIGVIVAVLTLYYNFLKSAKVRLECSKRALLIWHDQAIESIPMIDLWCTLMNEGAKAILVSYLTLEIIKKDKKQIYTDTLFLKFENDKLKTSSYSHPVFLNKYSSTTIIIAFKATENYKYSIGRYTAKVTAFGNKNKKISRTTFNFELDQKQLSNIKAKMKTNNATEIYSLS